jgi:hypothetical protein
MIESVDQYEEKMNRIFDLEITDQAGSEEYVNLIKEIKQFEDDGLLTPKEKELLGEKMFRKIAILDKYVRINKVLDNFIFAILNPRFWSAIRKTSHSIDEAYEILFNKVEEGKLYMVLSNYYLNFCYKDEESGEETPFCSIWISNYPYAYGYINSFDNTLFKEELMPTKYTRVLLRRFVNAQRKKLEITPKENLQNFKDAVDRL